MRAKIPGSLDEFRSTLLNKLLLATVLLGTPALVLSLWRIPIIGWKPVMAVHIGAWCLLWGLWLRRASISYAWRGGVFVAIFALVGLGGLLQFGLVGGGKTFTIFFCILTILLFTHRTGQLCVAAYLTLYTLISLLASQGGIEYALDFNQYLREPSIWFAETWTVVAFCTLLAYTAWYMVRGLMARESIAQAKLEQNQQLMQMQTDILESLPDAVVICDASGTIRLANQQALILFGYTREELLGASLESLLPTGLRERHAANRGDYFSAPRVRSMGTGLDLVAITRDGREIPVDISLGSVTTPDGTLAAATIRDITARRLADRERKRQMQLTRTVIDEMPDILMLKDDQGNFLLCNRALARLYNTTPEAMIGKQDGDFGVPREMADAFRRSCQEIIARGKGEIVYEDSRDAATGEIRHYKSIKVPLRDVAGRGQLLVIAQDITDLVRAQASIAENERRLQEVLAATREGIWDWHVQTGKVIHNAQWYVILGYGANEISGTVDGFASLVHPDDRAQVWLRLQALLDGSVDTYYSEHRLCRKEGQVIWVQDRGRIVERDNENRPVRVVGSFGEITERKQAEQEILQARQAAEEASRAKTAFLASMSHELRTPLNAVISMAQMLELGVPGPLNPRQQEAMGHILEGGRHLLGLINEVLDLARIESGKLDLSIEIMALDPLIEETLAITQAVAARHQITIDNNVTSHLAVRADHSRVLQVLLNLLSNAVKYNRAGGRVAISCTQHDDCVRIVVTDTGTGIPEAMHVQIFQPFQRLGAERSSIEGTGIGLTICKRLVEAMAGTIGFDSTPGVGSQFWFELPLGQVAAAIPEMPASLTTTQVHGADVHGRVVYVEDNPANVKVMEHVFLAMPGVELLTANDGPSALTLIPQVMPNLVLMDINLPGMSGIEVLKVLRSDPRLAGIPVIAVSAAAMPADIEAGRDAGFLDYITKPIDISLLMAKVQDVLHQNNDLLPKS